VAARRPLAKRKPPRGRLGEDELDDRQIIVFALEPAPALFVIPFRIAVTFLRCSCQYLQYGGRGDRLSRELTAHEPRLEKKEDIASCDCPAEVAS